METRAFGASQLRVSPVSYGLWEVGGPPFYNTTDGDAALALIRDAYAMGCRSFDTAPVYGFGHSETLLGRACKAFRHDIVISTKCGLSWKSPNLNAIVHDTSRSGIFRECENSLQRLQTDYIDFYLVHWSDKSTPLDVTIAALEALRDAGKIRYFGVSNTWPDELERYVSAGFIGIQQHHSLITHDAVLNAICQQRKIGFQAYSPLERGILTPLTYKALKAKKEKALTQHLGRFHSRMAAIDQLKAALTAIAGDVPLAQFVLYLTLRDPVISTVIVGSTKRDHIKTALAAATLKISQASVLEAQNILAGYHEANPKPRD